MIRAACDLEWLLSDMCGACTVSEAASGVDHVYSHFTSLS